MVDCDQENNEVCKDLLKTNDGIDRLAQYSSSVGRSVLILVSCVTFSLIFYSRDPD